MKLKAHPEGAILTEAALKALIPDHGAATIYDVNGVYPAVNVLTLTPESSIYSNASDFREVSMESKCGLTTRCLGDWNIGSNHNANYVFADKDAAEKYAEFAKNDPAMCQQRAEHIAECDRWDRIWDAPDYGEHD